MDTVINKYQSNLSFLWQHGKKLTLIILIALHIVFLGFCLKEHLTDISDRYYSPTSNIGIFVYHPDFYLNWIIILIFFVFFLFCPTQIFNKISSYFYLIIFIYFMGFFVFFIGSLFGVGFSIFYSNLSVYQNRATP